MSQHSGSAWYADFFTELPNAFWRAAVPPESTSAEVDFIIRVSGLRPGSRVLDVPCGSGRHALELARRGCHVTGLDVSGEAIDYARKLAADEQLPLDLRLGDMRELPADVAADVAICMGNAFGYLEHTGTQKFLADLAGLIVPGGALILDYGFVAEALLPHLTLEEPPMTFDGVEATSVNEYDTANSRWLTAFTFRRGAEEHRGTSVQYVYTTAEVVRLVTAAGFTDIDLYGDADGAAFHLGSHRLLLAARRPQAGLLHGSGAG
ncbi:MAG: cyclopropane-fatty-acyl-phospholipid synthase family protein [Pseudonocardiaceae bacterium]